MYETKESVTALIKETILQILVHIDEHASVEVEESISLGTVFNINTREPYLLIGRQGAHLHALQILVHSIVSRKVPYANMIRYTIDVDDYKRKREWFLKETAKQAVEHLKRTGRPVSLEPMPNYDRKLIHVYLQEHHPDVYTESAGFEPHRKIVIKLK